ncbi:hypothetical protein ACE1TF_13715 [Geomicrobium sp. JSM 1781026]|uniref:TcaA 3rd/4th domain-containing protein n=1 Tax=Geomicrobium sp. JSM 1781026 TaxID=3344580 RepID=UPI0035BF4069
MFCESCGSSLETDVKFCAECGTRIHKNVAKPSIKFSKPSKKQSVILASAAVVVGIGVGSVYILNELHSVDRAVAEFQELLHEQDRAALAAAVKSEGFGEAEAEGVLQLLDADPDLALTTHTAFEDYVAFYDADAAYAESSTGLFTIEREEGMLFNTYSFDVPKLTFEVSGDAGTFADVKIGETVSGTLDEDGFFFTEVYPGLYDVNLVYPSEYTELAVSDVAQVSESGGQLVMHFGASHLVIHDDWSSTVPSQLIINGEQTPYTVSDSFSAGMFPLDGSVTVAATYDFPWGTAETESVSVTDMHVIDLPPITSAIDDAQFEELATLLHDFHLESRDVVETEDQHLFTVPMRNELFNDRYFLNKFSGWANDDPLPFTVTWVSPESVDVSRVNDELTVKASALFGQADTEDADLIPDEYAVFDVTFVYDDDWTILNFSLDRHRSYLFEESATFIEA